MSVYVAAHKAFSTELPKSHKPICVGANKNGKLFELADNSGDNISDKNSTFCELTALYWVWKNTSDSYKGLAHYRRYFTDGKGIISQGEIERALMFYDVIVAKPAYLRETAYEEFSLHSGHSKDLDLLRETVAELYPDYIEAYDKIFASNKLHLYNMLIASDKVFDGYCEWLFGILLALEPKIDMTGYTDYEKRLYGFLGERLLNVYILKNKLSVYPCKVINTEMKPIAKLKIKLRGIKNKIIFSLKH